MKIRRRDRFGAAGAGVLGGLDGTACRSDRDDGTVRCGGGGKLGGRALKRRAAGTLPPRLPGFWFLWTAHFTHILLRKSLKALLDVTGQAKAVGKNPGETARRRRPIDVACNQRLG